MSASTVETASLPAFQNEPYTDFSQPSNRTAMEKALAKVRGELGREYPLLIDGDRVETGDKLISRNPSKPSEIIGIHHKADAELASRSIEAAHNYFPKWAHIPAAERAAMLIRAAGILRSRKLEFDAWLAVEAGKTWPEAEGETCRGDRLLRILCAPDDALRRAAATRYSCPVNASRLVYLPLGVGVIIPPWNFALAILAGMTAAALVTGNTAVIKPSSDTPTIAAKFAEVLLEAGFPAKSFFTAHRQRRAGRRRVGGASENALHRLHRLARRRPAHQRTGRETAPGSDLDQTRDRGDGRQGRHRRR